MSREEMLGGERVSCPSIVSRSQWGAQRSQCGTNLKTQRPNVIIHHTAGGSCNSLTTCSRVLKGIQSYHRNTLGWCDIGYNFLIGEDGRVYEGRGWSKMGAHAKNWNSLSLGISFMDKAPRAAALSAARSLIQCAVKRNVLRTSYTLKGHRNVRPTACPGNALYNIISRWPQFRA
uniref:Peptidoglycan-recognition protein n=1 Tax=Sphenodon punctatus TaxID=8508 RepID=A0A8D0L284_SPHPU